MEPLEFGRLYEEYANDVHRFALYLTGSKADAEDITSETFVRAWASSGRIRVGTVKAYLFTIARNLYLDWRRQDARHAPMPEQVTDPAPGPEAESSGRSELRTVVAALQALPEIDRSALLMHAVEGLSSEQVGLALGLSAAAVRVKVHRSRMRLLDLGRITP
jgi:RNA polymerase sigma-70 factor, ECF subfamily